MSEFEKFTILYVEDDDIIRDVNLRILKRMFKEVYEAENGQEGFDIYRSKKPDIILTDIKMPKMNGIELCKKIREKDKKTKIIISTAFSDKEYLLDAVELRLEKYIIKPLTKRNLIPALKQAISDIEKDKRVYFDEDFYYDGENRLFYFKEKEISLTKKELTFLRLLVEQRDSIVTYSTIEQVVWEDGYMSKDSLRTTVGFLRKKLPKNIIKNISNMGYKLNIDK